MNKIIMVIFLAMAINIHFSNFTNAKKMPKPPEESREELYHDLFITLLSPHIDKAINDYYAKLLTVLPLVYPYQVDIIRAERMYGYRSFKFLVVLEVTPVVGPHISVGKDRLTFEIPDKGPKMVKLKKFEHLETHELPSHWQGIVK